MTVELNHTIVWSTDKHAGAAFLAHVLGVEVGAETGPFVPVELSNSVTLDYADAIAPSPQHYAFRVDDTVFDAALQRVRAAGIEYWADPGHRQPGRLNTMSGGRGFYFADPDGHNLELLTA